MGFSDTLISWYKVNKRSLPWRETNSPYHIWLSEIILQQTRVAQGMSYYEKFVENYPTVKHLADASEDEVLKLWQGLGYYSRARNLHATAKFITAELDEIFPNSFQEIVKLKGVGDYTAAAIASFSFNEPVAVVDGNVYRVLSRYFNLDTPIDTSQGKKEFQMLANECLERNNPSEYNQAIMEFGALQCIPKPNCSDCPLRDTCQALAYNTISSLPVKSKKIKVKDRFFNYIVVSDGKSFIMQKREGNDIWKNLYQFPLFESDKEIESPLDIEADFLKTAEFSSVSKQYKHVLSHQRIFAKFWVFNAETFADMNNYLVVKKSAIGNYAIPRLIDKYLETLK